MESLMKPVTLTQDVTRVLDEIRAGAENALYGAGPDKAEELFAKHIVSLVEGAGLPVLQTMHYRWFLRELARLWRTRKGRDLAFHLELCIRKWVGLGLEPKTLQFLICEAYERLKGKFEEQSGNDECRTGTADAGLTTKTQRHEEVRPEPQNPSTVRQGPPRPTREPVISTTKTPSHQENPGSDTGILESSNPGTLPSDSSISPASTTKTPSHQAGSTMNDERGTMNERTKDAKTAKSEPDSDTRPLESSIPGPL